MVDNDSPCLAPIPINYPRSLPSESHRWVCSTVDGVGSSSGVGDHLNIHQPHPDIQQWGRTILIAKHIKREGFITLIPLISHTQEAVLFCTQEATHFLYPRSHDFLLGIYTYVGPWSGGVEYEGAGIIGFTMVYHILYSHWIGWSLQRAMGFYPHQRFRGVRKKIPSNPSTNPVIQTFTHLPGKKRSSKTSLLYTSRWADSRCHSAEGAVQLLLILGHSLFIFH